MVGLTERFDESFILLRHAMGWRLPMYMSVNAAGDSESPSVDEDAIAAIRERNRLDLELYDFGRPASIAWSRPISYHCCSTPCSAAAPP